MSEVNPPLFRAQRSGSEKLLDILRFEAEKELTSALPSDNIKRKKRGKGGTADEAAAGSDAGVPKKGENVGSH
jgi:hypothetical protein